MTDEIFIEVKLEEIVLESDKLLIVLFCLGVL